jgi:hypothetical protein
MSRDQASWQTQQEDIMRVDSTLQKLEVYVVAGVAVALVSFFLSSPFSAEDYGVANVPSQNSPQTSAAFQDSQPAALLEPALRSLDGVVYHG